MDVTYITVAEAHELFSQRDLSPVELTQMCLDRIRKLNPTLNAWITVDAEGALAQARAAEERMMQDARLSPLDGIPIGLKDNIDTAGMLTTGASNLFRDRIPAEDAVVVGLLRRAGAVILGKLNMHELAYGGSNYISAFGPARNPWNVKHLTGGSSGGAAVAVATGMCLAAIGSDTAGSIRLPAALCGVVGFKPSFGLVSCKGVIPLSWSLDHVGPITQSVEDAAMLMDVLALEIAKETDAYAEESLINDDEAQNESGEEEDETSERGPEFEGLISREREGRVELNPARVLPVFRSSYESYAARLAEARERHRGNGLRLGIPREHFLQDLHPQVAEAFDHVLEVFRSLDAEIMEIDVPANPDRTVQAAESYAYHERWVSEAVGESQSEARPQDYQPETLRRIRGGAAITAAEYIRARLAMEAEAANCDAIFDRVDAILTPTSPVPAPAFAQVESTPEQLRPLEVAMLRNTRPFSVLGLPAISVPCGFTKDGLPLGLQIVARHGDENMALIVADAYEQATVWHQRRPKI